MGLIKWLASCLPDMVVCVLAPPRSSCVTSSFVTDWNTEIVTYCEAQRLSHAGWNRLLLTGWNMKCHWLKQRDCHWNKETVTEIKRLSLSETRRWHRLKQRLSLPKTQSVKHNFFVSVNDWNKETVTNWNRETVTKRLSETDCHWLKHQDCYQQKYIQCLCVYVTDCMKINTKIAIGWLKHRLSLTKTQILLLRKKRKKSLSLTAWAKIVTDWLKQKEFDFLAETWLASL